MMQVITIAAVKGGTGKTTTAGALAQAAALAGKKVLMIDLDAQANLSMWYRGDLLLPGSYELITGSPAADTIQTVEGGLSLISGNANLTALKTTPASSKRLYEALRCLRNDFDFVFIDCAPALSESLYNALFASTGLIIPIEADRNSLQALYQIIDVTRHVQETRPELKIKGVVVTKYDARPRIVRFMIDTIKDTCRAEHVPYLMEIRSSVIIKECMTMQEPLYNYAPKSKPALDYLTLYDRIAGKKK